MFREARESAGIRSREEAAELLHVGSRTLASYELRETIPPADVVLTMSRIYNRPGMTQVYCKEYCPIGQAYSYELLNNINTDPVTVLIKLMEETREMNELLNGLFGCIVNKNRREDFTPDDWQRVEAFIQELMDIEHCIETLKISMGKWTDVATWVKRHNVKCHQRGYVKKEKAAM